jgi:hypothetical protein
LRYAWFTDLQGQFARLTQEHGRCEPKTALQTSGPFQGIFQLKCERGDLEFDVWLTPGRPSQVQYLGIRQTFPADERALNAAAALAALLRSWNEVSAEQWLASQLDREKSRKTLARLALEHGACTLEHGTRQVEHAPFGAKTELRFRLACASGQLDLALALEESSGKILEFAARPPAPPDATCWP